MRNRPELFRIVFPTIMLLGLLAVANVRLIAMQNSEAVHDKYRRRVVYVDAPPIIDGDLSDPVWEQADVIDLLVQQTPRFGEPGSEKTEVRVIHDSEAIYVAAYCYETDPSKRVANILTYRDDQIHGKDDVIRVAFDTFHDHRRAYAFSVNALNTKHDGFVDNRSFNHDWNEVWDVRTRIHEDGWSAEFRIPFASCDFHPARIRNGVSTSIEESATITSKTIGDRTRRLFSFTEWNTTGIWKESPQRSRDGTFNSYPTLRLRPIALAE